MSSLHGADNILFFALPPLEEEGGGTAGGVEMEWTQEADFQSVALIPKRGVWKRKTEKVKNGTTVIRH